MYLNNFVTNSLGRWLSQRTYLYCKDGQVQTISLLTTDILIKQMSAEEMKPVLELHKSNQGASSAMVLGTAIEFKTHETGNPEKVVRIGDMKLVFVSNDDLESGIVYRDKGYFSKDPVTSTFITTNAGIETTSTYGGGTYVETIEFPKFKLSTFENPIPYGTHRTRQTVGYRDGKITLVGQYLECKVV